MLKGLSRRSFITRAAATAAMASMGMEALSFASEVEEALEYQATNTLVEGLDCLIVAEVDGAKYALAYDEELTSVCVTEEDGIITLEDKKAVWIPREEDTIESAGTPGKFIFFGSHGFMIYTGGRTFEYDPETKTILMHKMYYLTFDPETGLFDESEDEADAAQITIYEPIPYLPKQMLLKRITSTS
ncbi:MAG: twin-arginine translocation signal domain-containing protein [Coriobacteriales bacterium]|nr:twin-arginine translocation signal domain-containing protein [Coriobacteriales bacterium]